MDEGLANFAVLCYDVCYYYLFTQIKNQGRPLAVKEGPNAICPFGGNE